MQALSKFHCEMKSLFLTCLLVELLWLSLGEEVIYCVRPTGTNIDCSNDDRCQKCDVLQYYFDNVDSTINQQINVTLLFMSGVHTVCSSSKSNFEIEVPVVRMIGDQNTTVTRCKCDDFGNYCKLELRSLNVTIQNIKFKNYDIFTLVKYRQTRPLSLIKVENCSFQSTYLLTTMPKAVIADNCTFQRDSTVAINFARNATIKNCVIKDNSYFEFFSVDSGIFEDSQIVNNSKMFIDESNVTIQGNSEFSGQTIDNVLFCHASTVILSGQILFSNNRAFNGGAMFLYQGTDLRIAMDTNVTVIFSNNTALSNGGAIFLYESTLSISESNDIRLIFINNTAHNKGGAIYILPGLTAALIPLSDHWVNELVGCFFQIHNSVNITVQLSQNLAANGGDAIYGAGIRGCDTNFDSSNNINIDITPNNSRSSVSSDPFNVCMCDHSGIPQCYTSENLNREIYPGQYFTVPVAVVGLELGTTTGIAYSSLVHTNNSLTVHLDSNAQNGYVISNIKQCSVLNFTVFSNNTGETVTIYISTVYLDAQTAPIFPKHTLYNGYPIIPIHFNVTLLQCPPGFVLADIRCDCYLHHKLFDACTIINRTGYFAWSTNKWAAVYDHNGILYDTLCPFDYCNITIGKLIDLETDSDSQCAFNRAGRLCGGCKEGYSLAIGSSHCIHCPNNNNLALLIFFAVAGFLLVLFITVLNLTVKQGMINGLIFYANVVWTYQSIFFQKNQANIVNFIVIFLKIFIAWLNLDFGIETCLASGLTAFWKTLLQFIFPFYIWAIAGLIIMISKKSNFLGERSVSVLCTLFLLSYSKLLRVVVTSLEFSYLMYTDQNSTRVHSVVWSVDGNLAYFGYPHVILFLSGLATLLILCLPFTLLLLFGQRLPNFRLLNWIMQLPVRDAYFAPLKDKHRYWFGVLLLARVILLMTFVSTFAVPQYVDLLLLLVVGAALMFYVAVVQPYRHIAVLTLNSAFFLNLTLLAGFVIVSSESNRPTLQIIAVGISTGLAFLQLCGLVLYLTFKIIKGNLNHAGHCNFKKQEENADNDFLNEIDREPDAPLNTADEAQPLLSAVRNSDVVTY